ncbi:MAG: tryptophan synthase subunit beta like protein [Candidatus Endonucleobacter sp. (ex Gigantidas childressi)]|nr:tryptophan synthase subunit beta like protein [Candidatus Endonucleobacter sp. (ex Gigantidas childressi)]
MLYVLRSDEGKIKAVSEEAISSEWQAVDLEDSALHSFLDNNPSHGSQVMKAVDINFIRVLEDVIDLLIDKKLIQFTELPASVQVKVLNRKRYREKLVPKDEALLFDSDDGSVI